MRLHELKVPAGARREPKRKGRGIAAGQGKTAGRGQKGQKARSGSKIRRGFEGGQMPLFQRLPKRGFTNIFKQQWAIVNLAALNRFDEDSVVTPEMLKEAGLIKSTNEPVKILGGGELNHKLTVKAHRFSRQAQDKIKAAGGKAEVI